MKRTAIHLAAAVLSLVLSVLCLPQKASAYTWIPEADMDRECSLTVSYRVPDVRFSLYRVADVTSHVTFQTLYPFNKYPVRYQNLGRDGWTDLAETLEGYVERDSIAALRTGVTDARGRLTFGGLDRGLYLVLGGDYYDKNGEHWEPVPFLICLPNWVEPENPGEEGWWTFDVTVEPKPSYIDPGLTQRRVLKVWQDGGRTDQRPKSITVDLLCDGRLYDSVVLNAENDWRWKWEDLDASHRWRVVERTVVDGYTTSVSLEGLTFRIVNRWSPPPDDPGTDPEDPKDPPPEDPPPDDPPPEGPPDIPLEDPDVPLGELPEIPLDDPDVPLDDGVYIDDMEIPLANLPQTGQLWWPVPLLSVAGMFFLILGWGWNRRSRFEEE